MNVYQWLVSGNWAALFCIGLVGAAVATLGGIVAEQRRRMQSESRAEEDRVRAFIMHLQSREPIWESHLRYAMRWARRRENRVLLDMVFLGELGVGIDKEGWIYLRPANSKALSGDHEA